jgi:glycosyltransferase involved in cell wall biosynthesis
MISKNLEDFMSEQLKISIVVCIYNGEKTLLALLNSLLNQNVSKDSYEVILIDDDSKDNSINVYSEFIKQNNHLVNISVVKKNNGGLSAARNTGIMNAKSPIVAFIDQDAVATTNWIENILESFNRNKEACMISGLALAFEEDNRFTKLIVDYFYTPPIGRKGYIGTNMAFKKSIFDRYGGFFDYFTHLGDETAFILLRDLKDFEIVYDRNIIVYHHFPTKIRDWLIEKQNNGKMKSIIDKSGNKVDKWNKKSSIFKSIFISSTKYSYFLLPFTLVFSFFYFEFFFIITLFIFFRLVCKVLLNTFSKIKGTLRNRKANVIKTMTAVYLLTFGEVLCYDYGYLKESIFGSKFNSKAHLVSSYRAQTTVSN